MQVNAGKVPTDRPIISTDARRAQRALGPVGPIALDTVGRVYWGH